jgi:superfamily I DNA and/or RNA helicase
MARFGRQDHIEAPFLSTVQVLSGTCLGVVGSRALGELKYDLCIVDEASKATPTEILVPLSRASRWVLVGDSKQLPPFQDEAMRDANLLKEYELRREDVSETLFSYLERALPASNVVSLTTQRRMVEPINDLIRACFYPDQELNCARKGADHKFTPALKAAITWIATSRSPRRAETRPKGGTGYRNKLECEVVNKLLRKLNKRFSKRDPERRKPRITIAMITGYSDQVALLERTLRPRSATWTHLDIMLNTVDAFQGRQADMVVYSVARSNPAKDLGFLSKSPRLNVALSRGRDALVVVGDRTFCLEARGENPFRDVIKWIDRNEGCRVEYVE